MSRVWRGGGRGSGGGGGGGGRGSEGTEDNSLVKHAPMFFKSGRQTAPCRRSNIGPVRGSTSDTYLVRRRLHHAAILAVPHDLLIVSLFGLHCTHLSLQLALRAALEQTRPRQTPAPFVKGSLCSSTLSNYLNHPSPCVDRRGFSNKKKKKEEKKFPLLYTVCLSVSLSHTHIQSSL